MPIERGVSNGLRRVKAPLTIQFGAQIRSFKELPVVIGSGVGCEFPVEHPHILEKHLQILFYDNTYRIEDLTGRTLVRVNNKPLDANRALQPNDEVQLSPHGPVFCFLGEGRFAEVIDEAAPGSSHVSDRPGSERFDPSPNKPAESIWEKIKNKF
jgi:pSer/pThr/pTyr-binding forkhead associated (FHA) protein